MNSVACVYCGKPATDLDHVVPRSRGGPDEPRNLVAACSACNADKSDQLPSEWLGEAAPSLVKAIERRVTKSVVVKFRGKRRGSPGQGLCEKYYEALVGMFARDGDDPCDVHVVCTARRLGYDPDEMWRHVGLIVRMRDDPGFDSAMGELRGIAREMKRRAIMARGSRKAERRA